MTTHTYSGEETGTHTVKLLVEDDGQGCLVDYDECTFIVTTDNDSDDMPDAWEDLYSLDDGDGDDWDDDIETGEPPGDGYNNLCEYLHKGNPTSIDSSLETTIIRVPADVSTLERALSVAIAGDEIWVAEGTHKPGTNRTDSFTLVGNVAVYGGFDSSFGETQRSHRDWETNVTILSGDIDDQGTDDS